MRADALPLLTEEGRRALVDYGVSLVVNLRPQREDDEDAMADLPVPVVRLAMDPRPVTAAWEWPTMREAYLGLADRYRAELAQALTLLGDTEPPAAIHCAGGRDRTGIACGMALWLAGVEHDAIAADHALSDLHLRRAQRELARPVGRREGARTAGTRRPAAGPHPRRRARGDRGGGGDPRAAARRPDADEAALDRLVARLRGEA